MRKRNWKKVWPGSLRDALNLCTEYARETRHLSVERIADQMGVVDHWTLRKWIQNGRFPLNMVRSFENVCGINLATRWLAASGDYLLIDIPKGRNADASDINVLQETLNTAAGQLIQFYSKKINAEDAMSAIQNALEGLAWHRGNVKKHMEPELDFSISREETL